jgi:two-component system, OmpR family, response regulator MprA
MGPEPVLLVVDDDPALRSVLRRGLGGLGYRVECVPSGRAALRAVVAHRPDVVILDLMLPDVDGTEVCRLLRRIEPRLPVLMLTGRDAELDQVAGLDAGADDYITKPVSLHVLDARVRAVLRRLAARPDLLSYDALRMDVPARRVFWKALEVKFTSTEFNVLLVLLRNAGDVVSKGQILQDVWSYEFGGDENVVEVYVAAIRRKLEAVGAPSLIQTIRGAGYALRSE